ncbi:aromatic amino acid transport family protein [Campylobacter troglodytis]|uniref:aromatic amino acid transport family protein n=1 Tax=Campylobacter troglodytis TaxID=654363 RepID=UPI00115815D9|nr:aromatic amino acid transport family protein [Campylobacter troglodytis]TQR53503.1 HAAAP family serine/threonine permease [Campylobacter troglodytis]
MKNKGFDYYWIFSLFGTAVGAGILFLPIRAGTGGFWAVVAMTVLIFPMVWLSHLALARFVLASKSKDHDITYAAEEFWGRRLSILITVLYFFAIYPICLAYGVGITNTFGNFFINQLNLSTLYDASTKELYPVVRAILAFVLVAAMMLVMLLKEELITKICTALVYPLCAVLFGFSLYLIPHWKLDLITSMPSAKDFFVVIWLTLPVLVFSFNHSPAISTFALSTRKEYEEQAGQKANSILFKTALMLLVFIMFFVFSCILALDNEDFAAAREANIPILSYFANKFDNPLISYGAPLVAFLAIVTSFFGHYFGAAEGLKGIIRKGLKMAGNETPNLRAINVFTTAFMFVSIVFVAYINPSILGFIEDLGGPVIAAILFIMPVIALYTVASMKKWQNKLVDCFVLITGLLTITSVVYKLL